VAAAPVRRCFQVLAKSHVTSTSKRRMKVMPQPWRQSDVFAKLSSNVTSRVAAPLSKIEDNDLLDMVLSEAKLLAEAFVVPAPPVA